MLTVSILTVNVLLALIAMMALLAFLPKKQVDLKPVRVRHTEPAHKRRF